jgi:hypothetical protein
MSVVLLGSWGGVASDPQTPSAAAIFPETVDHASTAPTVKRMAGQLSDDALRVPAGVLDPACEERTTGLADARSLVLFAQCGTD